MDISLITRSRFVLLLAIPLALAGCSGLSQPIGTAQPSLNPTLPLEIMPSETPVPTRTLTPSPSPTETIPPTPAPTLTPTPRPTLAPTQFVEVFQHFFSQGDDCPTPCVFGIIPGETSYDQASEVFRWLGRPLSKTTNPDDGRVFYSTIMSYQERGISISVFLTEENGLVKNMDIRIMLPKNPPLRDRGAWQAFTPDTLLDRYGFPSRVSFRLSFPTEEGFPPQTAWYDMFLNYEGLDLTVVYYHGLTVDEDFIQICPLSDQYSLLLIYLGKDLDYPPPPGVPLETVSSLTLEQFVELLNQQPETACFDVSQAAFFPSQ